MSSRQLLHLSFERARRAFSLIELAVVLIVIGIIAAIAIPTFQAAIERSEIRAAVSTQQAVARDVVAILAFQDGTTEQEALDTALAEVGSATAPGLSASATRKFELANAAASTASGPTKAVTTDPRLVSWSSDDDYLGWATSLQAHKGVKCRILLAGGSGECWGSASDANGFTALAGPDADVTLDDDGGGPVVVTTTTTSTTTSTTSTTSTTTTTLPLGVPTGLAVVSTTASTISLSWGAVGAADGYRVYLNGSVTPAGTVTSTSATLTGLAGATTYLVTVVAFDAARSSNATTAVTATTADAVHAMGSNNYGQLANSTVAATSTGSAGAVVLSNLVGTPSQISAGKDHACAIVSGAAYCWGNNASGQLGNNTTTDSATPVAVQGLSSGVTQISAGFDHSCAIVSGAAYCWGNNGNSGLGSPTVANSKIPNAVPTLSSGVVSIAAGYASCAVKSGGAAYCWGINTNGQLGDGTTTNRTGPTAVLSAAGTPLTGVTAISTGQKHTCAVLAAGTARCWGYQAFGQTGIRVTSGNLLYASTDVIVGATGSTPLSGVTSIQAATGENTCAVASGAAYCWGLGSSGQIGNNATTNVSVATPVTGLGSDVSTISTAGTSACATKTNGSLWCWGASGAGGAIGLPNTSASAPPSNPRKVATQVAGVTATDVASGTGFTIILNRA